MRGVIFVLGKASYSRALKLNVGLFSFQMVQVQSELIQETTATTMRMTTTMIITTMTEMMKSKARVTIPRKLGFLRMKGKTMVAMIMVVMMMKMMMEARRSKARKQWKHPSKAFPKMTLLHLRY